MNILINPDFKSLIPPLSATELEQLHRSLDARGCLSPLLVWKEQGILIDGHNRHDYCVANAIPFDVREVSLSSQDAARNFMILNQLGRRNMDPASISLLRGMLYNGRKKSDTERAAEGGKAKAAKDQNDTKQDSTAEAVAKETGSSPATVKRDAKFAEAAEELGVTKDILAGTETRSKSEIVKSAKENNPKPAKPARTKPARTKPAKKSAAWKPVVTMFRKLSFEDMVKAIKEIDKIYQAQ